MQPVQVRALSPPRSLPVKMAEAVALKGSMWLMPPPASVSKYVCVCALCECVCNMFDKHVPLHACKKINSQICE